MRHALLLLIIAFALVPSSAFAQSADELQKEGTAAYLAGDYPNAILKFTQAYDIDPNPIFQYNLSLCYGKLGNHAKALESADRAQARVEDLPEKIVPKNQARVASFAIRIAAEDAADEIKSAEQGSSSCESDSDCDGGFYCAADRTCQESESAPVTRERRLGAVGFVGIGLMVVGAGAATAALIVDAGLAPDLKTLEEDDTLTPDERDELSEDVARRQGQGRVLVFVGAGIGLVGAGLLIYDLMTVEEVPVALIPTIGPDRIGATLRWEF